MYTVPSNPPLMAQEAHFLETEMGLEFLCAALIVVAIATGIALILGDDGRPSPARRATKRFPRDERWDRTDAYRRGGR
jgi:hypothetical protein